MSRPLLSLVMMVKDEAVNIRAVLEAAKPHVDQWTILDTGSTDGTQDIIREVMADKPGRLHEEPAINCTFAPDIINFAATRNRVLELDDLVNNNESAEFQLMLSGDEHLRDGAALREYLEGQRDTNIDLHFVCVYTAEAMAPQGRVFRSGSKWFYIHELHETPTHPQLDDGSHAPVGVVPKAKIEHIVTDPERRIENIWDKHIPLLRAKLEMDPADTHALVFLAQSYETLLPFVEPWEKIQLSMEAMALHARRMELPFPNDSERLHVEMRFLDDARVSGIFTDKELFDRATLLAQRAPHLPEVALLRASMAMRCVPLQSLYELAAHAATVAENALQYKDDSAPLSTTVNWRAHHLAAVAAKQLATRGQGDCQGEAWSTVMRRHVSAGLAAGGDWEVFKLVELPKSEEATGS